MNNSNHNKKNDTKSIDIAKAIIQSDKYSQKEKKCIKALKYAALVAAMLASSACTGPMGIVLGGADIHEAYNRRQKIQLGIENLTERDRGELTALIEREVE